MLKRNLFLGLAGLLALVLQQPAVSAGQRLEAVPLNRLIEDHTVHGRYVKQGYPVRIYFYKDGRAERLADGQRQMGRYKINEDGELCVLWGRQEQCAYVVDNGNGSFDRVLRDGTVLVRWTKIVSGKDF